MDSLDTKRIAYFNPRTHVGCDVWSDPYVPCCQNFNPRTHVGCDGEGRSDGGADKDFNPRTHVGCDFMQQLCNSETSISIHAPTWGATVKPSNGWLLGHKDNEFANENIIIINSVNITWLSQPYYWCSTIANISALSATLGVRLCQIMSSSVKSVSLLSLKVSTLCFQFDPNE